MCDTLIVNFGEKYRGSDALSAISSAYDMDESNAMLETVGGYSKSGSRGGGSFRGDLGTFAQISSEIQRQSSVEYTKGVQSLETQIDRMQTELVKLITHFFHDVIENQSKITDDIAKLSQRMFKIEEISMNRSEKATKRGSIDTMASGNQQVAKKKIKKREALMASIVNLTHVVKEIPKSEKVTNLLYQQMQSNVVFQTCSEEELVKINMAFDSVTYTTGSLIFQQGSEADRFFVVEEGVLDVLQDGEHVDILKAPGSFGEISLLFGSSYHVTVCARSDCKLWCLHQEDYRAITSQYKLKRMQFKIDFLRKVKIADKVLGEVLEPSDIDDMALTTRNETFHKGDVIVREGDRGNVFYMIEEGSVSVYKKECGDKPLVTLSSGNFFGEKALLHSGDVRQATCIATSDTVKCLFLMREDFVRVLGDLQDLLDKSWKTQPMDVTVKKVVEEPIKDKKINIKLENLEMLRVLGTGAFSTVKLVKLKSNRLLFKIGADKRKVKTFALKCLHKSSDPNVNIDKLLQNEKEIMCQLDNPFIIHFFCEIQETDNTYFLLEALLGGELFNVLQDMSRFPEDWTRFYAANVLCAFTEIHDKRIAYRDLKPENLIMDEKGYIKIIDFGLAKKIRGGKSWTLCGTLDYLSPEMILNEGHDWAVDYWALGVLIYEITAGYSPFAVDDQFEMYRKILSCKIEIPKDFSKKLVDIVKALLRKDPSKRLGKTKGGTKKVMEHRWFSGLNWDDLYRKELKAPFVPQYLNLDYESDSDDSSDYKNETKDSVPSLIDTEVKRDSELNSFSKKKNLKVFETIDECASESTSSIKDIVPNKFVENIASKSNDFPTINESKNEVKMESIKSVSIAPISEVCESDDSSVDTDAMSSIVCSSISTQDPNFKTTSDGNVSSVEAMKEKEKITPKIFVNAKRLSVLEKKSFNRFSLFSVKAEKLTANALRGGNGSKFFDPFVTKSDQIDSFPVLGTDNDEISSFCFPNGASIRLIPKCTLNNAYKLGFIGEGTDRYQLHVFTDVSGARSYGISITVKEMLEINNSSNFFLLKKKRKAVATISDWWYDKFLNKRKGVDKMMPEGDTRRFSFAGPVNITDLTAVRKKSFVAFSSMISKVGQQMNNEVSSLMAEPPKEHFELTRHREKKIHQKVSGSKDNKVEREKKPISIGAKRKAIISYGNMMLNERHGLIAIVDKCYLLVGINPEEQSLLFNALQILVDTERQQKTSTMFDRNRSYDSVRHAALVEIQNKLRLSPEQTMVNYHHNERDHIQGKTKYLMHDFVSNGLNRGIEVPLPLPQVTNEWGVSTLVNRVKMSSLLILLKLLLLERSILVIGESYEDVTSCTCALLDLLKPFKWQSVFMPILPEGMLDFVSSPVPFIAGVVANTKEKLKQVESDPRVEYAMSCGLSILNITYGKIAITLEDGIRNTVSRCYSTVHLWDDENKLCCLQRRLKELVTDNKTPNKTTSLINFKSFFQNGPSCNERATLDSIRREICVHLSSLPSALFSKSTQHGWKQFGIFNEDTSEFDFHEDWYIESVRYQLQLEEKLAKTQLFIGYMDEVTSSSQIERDPKKLESAIRINKWLSTSWRKGKEKQRLIAAVT